MLKKITYNIAPTGCQDTVNKIKQRKKWVLVYYCCLIVVIFLSYLLFSFSQGKLLISYVHFASKTDGVFSIILHLLNLLCCFLFTYTSSFTYGLSIKTLYYGHSLMEVTTENVINNVKKNEQDVIHKSLKYCMQILEEVMT